MELLSLEPPEIVAIIAAIAIGFIVFSMWHSAICHHKWRLPRTFGQENWETCTKCGKIRRYSRYIK